jgi:hypothetical protein
MSSESITHATDIEILLDQLGSAASSLKQADRSALKKIKAVEKSLLKRAPRLEVWTPPLFQDQAKPPKSASASTKAMSRSVSLGFAPMDRLPQLENWLETTQWAAVGKSWGLVVREEFRTEGGKPASQRVVRLCKADLSLRIAAAPHLDALVRSIHDEVRTRVERLPPELMPSSAKPEKAKEATLPEGTSPAALEPVPA